LLIWDLLAILVTVRRFAVAVPLVLAVVVTSVRAVPTTAVAGRTVTVHVTTKPAHAKLRVLLRRAGHDIALRNVHRHGSKVTGRIPASTPPATYRVRVCPKVKHPHCRTAKKRLKVLAAATPAPAPGVAPSPQPAQTPDPGQAIPGPDPTPIGTVR
jgi:hypothetical protein